MAFNDYDDDGDVDNYEDSEDEELRAWYNEEWAWHDDVPYVLRTPIYQ